VTEARRTLLELYLAKSPDSEKIKEIARFEGVDTTPFPSKEKSDNCVLCGLCTRVCQDLGPAAISSLGRGTDKEVGPKPDGISEDCTGCGACAHICPTDAIPFTYKNQTLSIWNREFPVPVCSVKPEHCRGCGVCEEVCPHSIPRVSIYKSGATVSHIDPVACVGCGICAGACPTGAIRQKDISVSDNVLEQDSLQGRKIVFACSRSKLADDTEDIVPVSCVGGVSVDTMLDCLARGADGVALICRDRETCPFKQGGTLGESRATVAGELALSAGLGENRIQCIIPTYGADGPDQAIAQFRENCIQTPLKEIITPNKNRIIGIDRALDIIKWFKSRTELQPILPKPVTEIIEENGNGKDTLLYLGNLPELDLLLSLVMNEWRLRDIIKSAASLLASNNTKVRPVFTEKEVNESNASKVIVFSRKDLPVFSGNPDIVTLDEVAGKGSPFEVDSPEFTFRISDEQRKQLIEKIKSSSMLLCNTPQEMAQYILLMRKGSWKQSLDCRPYLAFTEVITDKEETKTAETEHRIQEHPILPPVGSETVEFTFNGKPLSARKGEAISSALYAAGISVFGHHHKDDGAQGIYCVNGQCSQCTVVANGKPVKSCMTPVTQAMNVESCEGAPNLTTSSGADNTTPEVEDISVPLLIVGGGPSGICAAIELGRLGVEVLIIDDKQELGGKLSLQTHNFFGSVNDCYAGDRGIDIGTRLASDLKLLPSVKVWLNSTVVGVFNDGKFGVAGNGTYRLVTPERVLISSGAREKSLSFPGCDLPGVYGAGAFQTLVNRDLVRCAERLFIVGGGNVGLIGAYHALQAGIDVVGLVEALPRCGGYKVHEDKIKRLGVPVWTSHSVLRIEGKERAERVVIAAIDDKFQPVPGTERSFNVDTVLIAVGLSPVDELLKKAQEYCMNVYAAGDAEEIAEASAAIFSGKITGRQIAHDMSINVPIPSNWHTFGDILKHRPGDAAPFEPEDQPVKVYPLIRCVQEIPCNPCVEACPKKLISMKDSILALPEYSSGCLGCGQCVLSCPGLAINLVINDYDPKKKTALIMLPFEFNSESIPLGKEVVTTDMEGNIVGNGTVIAVRDREVQNRRKLLLLEVPDKDKLKVAGFQIREPTQGEPTQDTAETSDDPMVCRCERVKRSEIAREIRAGVRDMNQLKAIVRSGMGGCGGKTCTELILRIYREEGIPLSEVTLPSNRPLVAEVHLGDFIKSVDKESK
jgi:heterodisulfide reductase subunit A-like polyferredoxin